MQTSLFLSPELFNNIAPRYDLINLALSGGFVLFWDGALRRAIARSGAKGGFCAPALLDLGCGTLRFTRGLPQQMPGLRILGLDPSGAMLKYGLARMTPAALERLQAVRGVAENLPFSDNSLDLAVSQFAWRNINSRPRALAEIRRTLKPGGRMFIMEFGSGGERVWGGLYNFYLRVVLPRLGGVLSGQAGAYARLAQSIQDFPPSLDITGEIRAAGFIDVTCARLTSGIVRLYTACKP